MLEVVGSGMPDCLIPTIQSSLLHYCSMCKEGKV